MSPLTKIGNKSKQLYRKHFQRKRGQAHECPPNYADYTSEHGPPPPYSQFAGPGESTIAVSPYVSTEIGDSRSSDRLSPVHEENTTISNRRSDRTLQVLDHCRNSDEVSEISRRSSLSSEDVRPWTECLRWIAQYSLHENFKKTIQHFEAMVQRALKMKRCQSEPNAFLILTSTLDTQPPTSLSHHHWEEMTQGLGFVLPRCACQDTDDTLDYVIVPASINNKDLVLFSLIFQSILDLPFNVVRMIAYLEKDEMDFVLYLLSFYVSHPYHPSLDCNDYLITPIWDLNRRPGCLLRELGFHEQRYSNGRRSVLFPQDDVRRKRIQLVTDVMRTFQYGDTTRVILV